MPTATAAQQITWEHLASNQASDPPVLAPLEPSFFRYPDDETVILTPSAPKTTKASPRHAQKGLYTSFGGGSHLGTVIVSATLDRLASNKSCWRALVA